MADLRPAVIAVITKPCEDQRDVGRFADIHDQRGIAIIYKGASGSRRLTDGAQPMKRLTFLLATVAALTASTSAMAALAVGAKAPEFTTRGAMAGKTFTLTLSHQLKRGRSSSISSPRRSRRAVRPKRANLPTISTSSRQRVRR